MLNIVLIQQEIPPNTGNIIRLCAATGGAPQLAEPLGFALQVNHADRIRTHTNLAQPSAHSRKPHGIVHLCGWSGCASHTFRRFSFASGNSYVRGYPGCHSRLVHPSLWLAPCCPFLWPSASCRSGLLRLAASPASGGVIWLTLHSRGTAAERRPLNFNDRRLRRAGLNPARAVAVACGEAWRQPACSGAAP